MSIVRVCPIHSQRSIGWYLSLEGTYLSLMTKIKKNKNDTSISYRIDVTRPIPSMNS